MLRAEKEVRSCGSIVGGSAVPAYYDGGGFGAKCKDFAVSDERLLPSMEATGTRHKFSSKCFWPNGIWELTHNSIDGAESCFQN